MRLCGSWHEAPQRPSQGTSDPEEIQVTQNFRTLAKRLHLTPVYQLWKNWETQARWRAYRSRGPQEIRSYVAHCEQVNQGIRLQVGSGGRILPGWLNTEYDVYHGCVFLDITQPLPFADGAVELILAEHVIANLPKDGAMLFFRESFRRLRLGGILRLSTPNLTALSRLLITDDMNDVKVGLLRRHQRLYRPGEEISFCDLVNDIHYLWGHRYLYTEEELFDQLRVAGFTQIERCSFGQSRDPRLVGIDQHQAGREMAYIDLIVEAVR